MFRPTVAKLGGGTGKGLLIVDDLVDTGKTGRLVREMMPDAHFAAVYAKPQGKPLVDTFITEVSQDTWIYFPWDTALSFQPPIRRKPGAHSDSSSYGQFAGAWQIQHLLFVMPGLVPGIHVFLTPSA